MEYEYTDTFGGEANYSWVKRGNIVLTKDSKRPLMSALRKARKEIGITGVKGRIVADFGDEIHWKPTGMCHILMVRITY